MADLQDLKSKALKGSMWAVVEKFSLQIVQFIVGVILARLLDPKDYGLIALTTIFTSISAAITDGGFEKTLIRKKELLPVEKNSVFYVNILLGALMTATLFVSAPFIAAFFKEPALIPVLHVTSMGLLINAFGQTQRTLLMKELRFKKISFAQIFSSLAGGLTGIWMAYAGFGVWSLVYSGIITQFVAVTFFWIGSDWYPGWKFSFAAIREMLPYGSRILLSSLLFFAMLQFNNFIVGKLYNRTELGLFNRGSRLPELIISILQSVVLKMAFPLFAKVQENSLQMGQMVRKTMRLVAFISFPLLVLLLMNAREITIVLFTDKWVGSVIFLELFCIARLFEPFVALYRELILSMGHARLLLRIFVLTSVMEILLTLFLSRYGIIYIVIGAAAGKLAQYSIYISVASRRTGVPWFKQLEWILPYLVFSVIAGFTVKIIGYAFRGAGWPLSLDLSFKLMAGLAIYLALARVRNVDELSLIRLLYRMIGKKIKLFQQHEA